MIRMFNIRLVDCDIGMHGNCIELGKMYTDSINTQNMCAFCNNW